MKRIGLLSDTHGFLDPKLRKYLDTCDEIWHAGDIGTTEVTDTLASWKPLRAVHGNIDGTELRSVHPEDQLFELEGVKVLMTHIGGYPGRYTARARQLILTHRPKLYICGHSHILKVMNDTRLGLLHMNPGAAGAHGLHHMKTLLRFTLDEGQIKDLEVIELGRRGVIEP